MVALWWHCGGTVAECGWPAGGGESFRSSHGLLRKGSITPQPGKAWRGGSNSAAAQTATVPFFSDGEGVLECACGSPSGRNLRNILDLFRLHFGLLGSLGGPNGGLQAEGQILESFWLHFELLGCLGEPMGAFRLKDRF